VKEFSTIIINVTPSPWSRPGSSHEDIPMHENTHAHTHAPVCVYISVGIPAKDGGCYLALDAVMYQARCQVSLLLVLLYMLCSFIVIPMSELM
jgi:hypothetical protein